MTQLEIFERAVLLFAEFVATNRWDSALRMAALAEAVWPQARAEARSVEQEA